MPVKVISAEQHQIPESRVHSGAVSVVRRLKEDGFQAFVVGGAVRDLMLGGHPKDFDVATDATPEQVRERFRGARIIGRRFQIVHVRMGREIIEVTTFRGHGEDSNSKRRESDKGLLLRDNVYGTLDEDAARRDLSVNAMYYDPDTRQVYDHMNGVEDIHNRLVRIIGDPQQRYREDPVRMLRVARFSAKLQFDIETETEHAIQVCSPLLSEIPAARLFDEFLKLFMAGYAKPTLQLLDHHGLLQYLFPEPAHHFQRNESARHLMLEATGNTDKRVHAGKPVTPAFLLAALHWPVVQHVAAQLEHAGEPTVQATHSAGQQIIAEACLHTAIPKRFSIPMREIWDFQPRLEQCKSRRVKDMLASRRFRAAWDLLLLREAAGEDVEQAVAFWGEQQEKFADIVGSAPPQNDDRPPKRRPRRRRRNP
ncbi:MAG: polynucleotide adenylyltransferase PcnB [Halieaceae bacterium]|jgi:poly(A) polymerase|nr:polynucleotide adenylyltransferase PcnB [Halieaceae bacterium]